MKTIGEVTDELAGLSPGLTEYLTDLYRGELEGLTNLSVDDAEVAGYVYGLSAVVDGLATGAVTREQAEELIAFARGDGGPYDDHEVGELAVYRWESGVLQVDRLEYAESRQGPSGSLLMEDGSWEVPA